MTIGQLMTVKSFEETATGERVAKDVDAYLCGQWSCPAFTFGASDMCCGDCSPIRCPAVPDTDWSAFTWRWQNAAYEPFPVQSDFGSGGPEAEEVEFTRQIQSVDRSMIHRVNVLLVARERHRRLDEREQRWRLPVSCDRSSAAGRPVVAAHHRSMAVGILVAVVA